MLGKSIVYLYKGDYKLKTLVLQACRTFSWAQLPQGSSLDRHLAKWLTGTGIEMTCNDSRKTDVELCGEFSATCQAPLVALISLTHPASDKSFGSGVSN